MDGLDDVGHWGVGVGRTVWVRKVRQVLDGGIMEEFGGAFGAALDAGKALVGGSLGCKVELLCRRQPWHLVAINPAFPFACIIGRVLVGAQWPLNGPLFQGRGYGGELAGCRFVD